MLLQFDQDLLGDVLEVFEYAHAGDCAALKRRDIAGIQELVHIFHWSKSNLIREYTKAVRDSALSSHGPLDPESKLSRWIEWANQQADRLDPLVDS